MAASDDRGYRSVEVPIGLLDFNPWNPNRQTDETYRKVKASLQAYGMVELPQVRRLGERYQVINGEHRVRAAAELGWQTIPVFDLGVVSDQVAKKLTIITNELRGAPEPTAMSKLVRDLSAQEDLATLSNELPMSESELSSLSKLTEAFDWDAVERTLPASDGGEGEVGPHRPPPNLGGERKFQVATVRGSIPVDLANALVAEYNRSAAAVGSMGVEVVVRDLVDRLAVTAAATEERAAAREPSTPAQARGRRRAS